MGDPLEPSYRLQPSLPCAVPYSSSASSASAGGVPVLSPPAVLASRSLEPLPVPQTEQQPQMSAFHLLLGAVNSLPKALLGWPLDTSKTLLQTTSPQTYPPPFRTLRVLERTISEHGVLGLYKGVAGPALGWAVIDAGLLGGLWKFRGALFEAGWREENAANGEERLSIGGHFLAGSLAGLAIVPVAHPVDLVKNKLQFALRVSPTSPIAPSLSYPPLHRALYPLPVRRRVRAPGLSPAAPAFFGFFTPSNSPPPPAHVCPPGGSRYHSSRATVPAAAAAASASVGPFGMLQRIYAEGGIVKGVYRAVGWTMVCRTGAGIMFGAYELLLRAQDRVWGDHGGNKTLKTFVAGGLSSVVYWSLFLPADNVKAVLFTDASNPSKRRFPTSRSAIAHILSLAPALSDPAPVSVLGRVRAQARRLRPFWRGGGAVVARASVVNGVGLVLWEGAMNAVGERTLS